jgi:DNA (cytosine-5)-methyltransferase 1
MSRKKTYLTVSDNFCGFGGNSLGVRSCADKMGGGLEVVEAANHWHVAVNAYQKNFPGARVHLADLQQISPRSICSTDIHFSSPSCQKHSKASGKKRKHQRQPQLFDNTPLKPEDIRSRETMMCVPHFAEVHNYNAVVVENVVEVVEWAGYEAWRLYMDSLGYRCQKLHLNSMFFHPCPQSRDRVYFVFTKKRNKKPDLEFRPKAWCTRCERDVESQQKFKPGHSPKAVYGVQYDYVCSHCAQVVVPYYYAAFNAIDWTVKAERIGDRKKPLVENTRRRIEHGWKKYGNVPMLLKNSHGSGVDCRIREAATGPMFGLHTKNATSVVFPWIIDSGFEFNQNGQHGTSANAFRSFTTGHTGGFAYPPGFIATQRGTSEAHLKTSAHGYDEPLTTISAEGNHHGLVTMNAFVSAYYNGGDVNKRVVDPFPTFRTKQSHALVQSHTIPESIDDLYYRMFRSHEHRKGMAFPDDFAVTGDETEAEMVKGFGNAVTPPIPEWIMGRLLETFW